MLNPFLDHTEKVLPGDIAYTGQVIGFRKVGKEGLTVLQSCSVAICNRFAALAVDYLTPFCLPKSVLHIVANKMETDAVLEC